MFTAARANRSHETGLCGCRLLGCLSDEHHCRFKGKNGTTIQVLHLKQYFPAGKSHRKSDSPSSGMWLIHVTYNGDVKDYDDSGDSSMIQSDSPIDILVRRKQNTLDMHTYYRISDNSFTKPKVPCCTKEYCLTNFIEIFRHDHNVKHCVIADNCEHTTVAIAQQLVGQENVIISNLGNAGAVRYAMAKAAALAHPDEIVYFVEDDYVHDPRCADAIQTPVADYWTVYDHPDKYGPLYDYGEVAKVFKKTGFHWRYTISTTMTFATKVRTLKEDLYTTWWQYIDAQHPCDHFAFVDLFRKGRRLACSIPGMAWHTDLAESYRQGILDIDQALFDFVLHDLYPRTGQDVNFLNVLQERIRDENRAKRPYGPVEALAVLEKMLGTEKRN